MNEIKTTHYENLNGKLRGQLKTAYNSLEKNMLKIATLCYQLKSQDADEFRRFCDNELNASGSTISKFVKVGELLEVSQIELPDTYTKIYALEKVKENLVDFNEYCKDIYGHDVSAMPIREINEAVREYNEPFKDMKVEESEPDEVEEVEESEVVEEDTSEVIEEPHNNLKLLNLFTDIESSINMLDVKKVSIPEYEKLQVMIEDFKEVLLNEDR